MIFSQTTTFLFLFDNIEMSIQFSIGIITLVIPWRNILAILPFNVFFPITMDVHCYEVQKNEGTIITVLSSRRKFIYQPAKPIVSLL